MLETDRKGCSLHRYSDLACALSKNGPHLSWIFGCIDVRMGVWRAGVVDDVCGSVVSLIVVLKLFFIYTLNVCQVSSRTGIRRWELITADYGPDINHLEQVFAVPRPGSIVAAVKTGEGRLFVFEEVFGGGLRVNVF